MTGKVILFDLDGTLTDSGEGIMNCARLALTHFGIEPPGDDVMRTIVGPPLDQSFVRLGVPADKTGEAIAVYRSRYQTIGKYENFPYPGIREVLQTLKAHGHRLFVATSKPEETSKDILHKFELADYFEIIAGATFDGSRKSKAQVIAYLLGQIGNAENVIMVGDTAFDVIGANAHHIPAIGVAWGYGEIADMIDAGAQAIAYSMDELLAILEA